MEAVEGKGVTEEEAMADAAAKLGVAADEMRVESVKQGKKFLGLLGESGFVVRATKRPPGEEVSSAEASQVRSAIKQTLEDILGFMGIEAQVTVTEETDTVKADIASEEGGLLIGKRGETLDSLEYLLNRMVNRTLEERVFIAVDTEDYRNKRKHKLLEMARSAIDEVRETGKPYRFQNLNAKERKIIHLAVQEEEGVDSISKGEGYERKLIVKKV